MISICFSLLASYRKGGARSKRFQNVVSISSLISTDHVQKSTEATSIAWYAESPARLYTLLIISE